MPAASSRGGTRDVVPAVVLRTTAIRESDLIVGLLTPTAGKVDVIARGARRSRKRFPGGLPIGSRGEATIVRGRGSLARLDGFASGFNQTMLGRDLTAFAWVHYLCEIAEQLVGGSAAVPSVFAELCVAIDAVLETAKTGNEHDPAILRRFELGLLDGLGLLPALERCGVCQRAGHEDERGLAFSIERGGVMCELHAYEAGRIPGELRALALAVLNASEPSQVALATYDPALRRGLRDLCRDLLRPHQRGPLRSLDFFTQISRGGAG